MPEFDAAVVFRPVVGFPGYVVGSDGSIWSCWKKTGRKGGRDMGSVWTRLDSRTSRGYVRVAMKSESGIRRSMYVHQLVLVAFIGPCPDGMEACHGAGGPGDNCLSNLRWDTHSANTWDAIYAGVFRVGSRKRDAKLTETVIPRILQLLQNGWTQKAIATMYGVDRSQISRIKNGKRWKHIHAVRPV